MSPDTPEHKGDFRRRIRSFVRREGRLTRAQQRAMEELWPRYGVEPKGLIDFPALFGCDCEVVLEIGFGDGKSLAQMAAADPERCFLGVEVHRPGVGSLLQELEHRGLENVRIASLDAVELLTDHIPDASLSRVQIFFPDPWPKARHHKRRLIQPDFVALLARKLKPGGVLHLATDWQDYAEHMLSVMQMSVGFVNLAESGAFAPRLPWRPETKFERRGLRLGHGVWDLRYRRTE